MMKRGLLLINLGTPKSAEVHDVRRFLGEFLIDKRVIDLPVFLRYLLVFGFILPLKPRQSAKAYNLIWANEGSPLLSHSKQLVEILQKQAVTFTKISLGMRYGKPSIKDALEELKHCDSITLLPLYPQYSSAATGSALEDSFRHLGKFDLIPSVHVIHEFYNKQAYIKAKARIIKASMQPSDFLLFSYHGIPERQLRKMGCQKICILPCPLDDEQKHRCYKFQCYDTSRLLAKELNLPPEQYTTAFQSRLGKTPWIKPYTDEELSRLALRGIKNLSICCPSFVTDCLETLEEIGIRAKKQWQAFGGEEFRLVPSLNADPGWAKAILEMTGFGTTEIT